MSATIDPKYQNLKPQSVIDAMEKYCDNFKGGFMNVHRNSMTIGDKEIL